MLAASETRLFDPAPFETTNVSRSIVEHEADIERELGYDDNEPCDWCGATRCRCDELADDAKEMGRGL